MTSHHHYKNTSTVSITVNLINLIVIIIKNTGMITIEDFLFTEDKHKLSDYPDEESVDKVRSFFFSTVLFLTQVAHQVWNKNSDYNQ